MTAPDPALACCFMPALFVQPLGETSDTAVLTVLQGLESIHKTKFP